MAHLLRSTDVLSSYVGLLLPLRPAGRIGTVGDGKRVAHESEKNRRHPCEGSRTTEERDEFSQCQFKDTEH